MLSGSCTLGGHSVAPAPRTTRCARLLSHAQASTSGSGAANSSGTATPKAPRTCSEAVSQARNSFRAFREARAAGTFPQPDGSGPVRLTVELPVPVGRRSGFLQAAPAEGSLAADPDLIVVEDESDFPGGVEQRFRLIRPLVDRLLDGYGATFVGLLESDADGCGCWSLPDATVVGPVYNATFPSLLKLVEGGYGSRPQSPDHTLITINSTWTSPQDIGQPWDWGLRKRCGELMDGNGGWQSLYTARMLRSSRGALGLLHHAWPHRWCLYPAVSGDASELGDCILASAAKPSTEDILAALNEARPAMEARAKELKSSSSGSSRKWW